MRRRSFCAPWLLGGLAPWPIGARAQAPETLVRVGVLRLP